MPTALIRRLTGLAALAILLLPPTALAQAHRGAIRGRVTGPNQSTIGNVPVVVVHHETGAARQVVTSDDGEFAIGSLPPGSYTLTIETTGFKKFVQAIELAVNQQFRTAPRLDVGQVAEEVRVVAPYPAVRQDSVAVGTLIDNRQVVELPLDGRNVLELSLLAAGSVPAAQGSAGSVRGDFAMHVNGAREDSNAYLLDGAYNIDPKLNAIALRPPVDAVQEFEVVSATYDATFGRNGGAQINVVTKSGTNALSGTAFEFFRNGALDARNVFAPRDAEAPEYNRNQFGVSLGGPIARDRTFFFGVYEGTRSREGITRITTVPTEAERRGDFSASGRPLFNPFSGMPFSGNQIPEQMLHPIGAALAALYPLPNRQAATGNFVSSPVQTDRVDHADGRLDHVFAGGSDLMVRYSFSDRDLFEPFAGATSSAVPGFGLATPRRAQNLVAGYTSLLSASLVNETRVAFNRVSIGVLPENAGTSLNRELGLPELSDDPRDWGLSFIRVSGYSPIGDDITAPQEGTTNAYQLTNTLTMSRGRHLLKMGGEFRAVRQDAFRDVLARGLITFAPAFTGNALADLLLGFPVATVGAEIDNPQRLRTETWSAYVHDSVRLAPSLTISAGLRYDVTSPPVDADDRAVVYDAQTGSLVRVGTGGVPRAGYESDRNNLAPRAGLAWTPDTGTTVVRGGYGVYYDQPGLAPGEGLYFSPPFYNSNLYVPLPGYFITLYDPFPATYPFPLPDSATTFQRDLETPFYHHVTANVQRQLGPTRAIEIGYVGTRGRNLLAARDINQPAPSQQVPNVRPNPLFDDITQIESTGESRYDSLQVKVQQRLEGGLSVLAGYTLGKSTDNTSGIFASSGDPNFPQDSRNLDAEQARSSFDVRHRLSISFSYDLPFARTATGLAAALARGWQLAGIVTVQSGYPFTVALLPEIDRSNTGRSTLGFGGNDRPNVVGDPTVADPGSAMWFNPAAFAFPAFGTFGDAERNALEGPGYKNVNLALMKHVALGARARLQLRLEAFNLFNWVNFDQPDNFLGSPTFGQILSAGPPRHVQVGARLIF